MKRILLSTAFVLGFFCIACAEENACSAESETHTCVPSVQKYVAQTEGADGKIFLDPYLNQELIDLSGKCVLDAGCGAAPWSIVAAQNGAKVCGIDLQRSMIEKAQIAIARAGVESQISLAEGDVEKLPYEAARFDRALSINLGCNLPRTTHILSENSLQVTGLGAHFKELHRVLKDEGMALVTAPASFDIVFTDNTSDEKAALAHIDAVLAKVEGNDNPDVILQNLGELKEVLRASFVKREGKLVLVKDEKELSIGEQIWRKTPEGVVPNYYHSEEEYLVSLKNAGLTCTEIKRPCFFGKVKYDMYRKSLQEGEKGLGEAYIDHHPFTIYYVTKKA